jgi:NTE family protein
VRIGDLTLPQENTNNGGYFARFSYDKVDSRFFPRHGEQFDMQWQGQRENLGADRETDRVAISALVARSVGRHSLIFSANAGSTLNSQTFPQDYFSLGGFLNLSGLRPGELSGPHFGIGRLTYYHRLGTNGGGVFDVPLYAGLSFETGNVWQIRSDARYGDLRKNASVFIGADTILGPVYLGAGGDSHGESAFYLFLGRTF